MIDDIVRVEPSKTNYGYTKLHLLDHTTAPLGQEKILLSRREVEQLIDALEAAIDPERNITYVQVQVSGASNQWTYIDPSGELKVGDRVLVPFGYDDAEWVAKVTALGKGHVPSGVTIKSVAARLDVEELTPAA